MGQATKGRLGVRAGDLLRRIDRRVLPPLADALHRLSRGPGRLRGLLLAVGCATTLMVAAFWTGGRSPLTSEDGVTDVVRVGVPPGQSIPDYLAASRRELAFLATASPPADQTYALVTLAAYLAPERLTPVVRQLAVSAVYVRVPLPHAETEIVRVDAFRVPEDVIAGMELVALRKDGEALDLRDLSAKLTGAGARERQLRAAYDSGARIAQAEAEAYRQQCSCVYAVIVRATPATLADIAARTEVRAVDPATEVRRLDRAVFLPPLPEQAKATPPGATPGRSFAARRNVPADERGAG